jgi:hypothetical protein
MFLVRLIVVCAYIGVGVLFYCVRQAVSTPPPFGAPCFALPSCLACFLTQTLVHPSAANGGLE